MLRLVQQEGSTTKRLRVRARPLPSALHGARLVGAVVINGRHAGHRCGACWVLH